MATVNIYVSDELKARMGQHDLKWSQIAASAIETAINLEERKAVNMEAASIERLRASRNSAGEARYANGVAIGKTWALNVSEFDDLERVAKLDDTHIEDEAYDFTLAAALLNDESPSARDCAEVFEVIFQRADPSQDECRGFIDGAVEVYNEV